MHRNLLSQVEIVNLKKLVQREKERSERELIIQRSLQKHRQFIEAQAEESISLKKYIQENFNTDGTLTNCRGQKQTGCYNDKVQDKKDLKSLIKSTIDPFYHIQCKLEVYGGRGNYEIKKDAFASMEDAALRLYWRII